MHVAIAEFIATASNRSRRTAKWLTSDRASEELRALDDVLLSNENVYFIDTAAIVLPDTNYNGGGMLMITDHKFVFCGTTNVALRLAEIIEYSGRRGPRWVIARLGSPATTDGWSEEDSGIVRVHPSFDERASSHSCSLSISRTTCLYMSRRSASS